MYAEMEEIGAPSEDPTVDEGDFFIEKQSRI